jgi:putative holliday junction resolvase
MKSNSAPIDHVAGGRLMGLDVGDRRIGVAVSDDLGIRAQPILTLTRQNRRQDLRSLARLLRKQGCSEIIVGNPLYMSGDLSPQAIKAQSFAQALREETGVPVHLWDERLSTTEAHRHLDLAGRKPGARRAVIDQLAAVLILQSFLDARRANGSSHPAPEAGPAGAPDDEP